MPERGSARAVWANVVAEALRKRNITVNAAAGEIGVSRNTLQTWLNGKADADLRTFDKLAELTGISHVLLLELAGVLPPELASTAYQTHAARELRDGLVRMKLWVDQALDVTDSPPAAQVAGALLARGWDWAVTLRPAVRGREYRLLQHTYLGVEPLHRPALPEEDARKQVHDLLSHLYVPYGLTWREQKAHDYSLHPRFVLQVPDHERPRAASAPDRHAPAPILTIGLPYAHAEFLGSYVAHALGYGYADLRYGPRAPGAMRSENERVAAMVEHAEQLLAEDSKRLVWSLADHRVLRILHERLRTATLPLVLIVEPGPRLRARGCEVWEVPEAEMAERYEQLRGYLDDPPWPTVHLPVDDDDLLVNGEVDTDLLVDAMVRLSIDALTALHRHHNGPGPRQWLHLPGR
jgi:transcriptional regulator with XRE-family HTH domain